MFNYQDIFNILNIIASYFLLYKLLYHKSTSLSQSTEKCSHRSNIMLYLDAGAINQHRILPDGGLLRL